MCITQTFVSHKSYALWVVLPDVQINAIACIFASHVDFLDVDVVAQRVNLVQDADVWAVLYDVDGEVYWHVVVDGGRQQGLA